MLTKLKIQWNCHEGLGHLINNQQYNDKTF